MDGWKHLKAVLVLPFNVTLVIPTVILYFTGFDTLGLWEAFPVLGVLMPLTGAAIIGLGITLLVATNCLFATIGKGTLAPWAPPQNLVIRGPYRHVRNPMISGVIFMLFGEAFATASLPLAGWFAFFTVAQHLQLLYVEEPGLVERFGDDYVEYRENVPRWIPRLDPWQP